MYSSKMFDQNPWWEDASNIRLDPHIRAREESVLRWSPQICFEGADLVYSLRGTRQVGKTTTVKRFSDKSGRRVILSRFRILHEATIPYLTKAYYKYCQFVQYVWDAGQPRAWRT